MNAADVPLGALIGSFLKACKSQNVEAVVWTAPRDTGRAQVSSNTGEGGIGKLRTQLLVKNGGIEAAAAAVHGFRIVEEGKPVEPMMDFCCFLPCAGHRDEASSAMGRGYGAVPWEELPEDLKNAHRELVKVILGSALSGGVPRPPLQSV